MTQPPSDTPALFKDRHFDRLLIIQAVRWYITYKLSYRDVRDLMAERGVTLVHTTIMRWVQRFTSAITGMEASIPQTWEALIAV